MKPVITIRYDSEEQPTVTLPPELHHVELQFIDTVEEGTRLMSYKGVTIYWAWKGFATCEHNVAIRPRMDVEDNPYGEIFDLRTLPPCPEDKQRGYGDAIEYFDGRDEDVQALAWAIDQGWLTVDGLELPKETK